MNVQIDPSYKYTFSVPAIKFAISFFYSVVCYLCVMCVSFSLALSHLVRVSASECVESTQYKT